MKKNEIKITAGDKLNLNKNIESVKDRIDGELKYSKEKVEKSGYYIDKGKFLSWLDAQTQMEKRDHYGW